MSKLLDAIVAGSGQAGLPVSRHLKNKGVGHSVLDRGQIVDTWRIRSGSICMVTLIHHCRR
ncbi:hypothetical protein [Alloyangia pacifica]|uniref:hypothetical protein n=1 Tax=Alloyangia pacifica TaxID=311180 RepID=UPI0011610917|nr:hypothetical protein [Alloyangia pacifica]